MSWRVARSLVQLRAEVDRLRPGRSTAIDGTIGDADHRTRTSDHNPWVPPPGGGVVTAMDITDDAGTLTDLLAEKLRASRDPRIKYVIGERRMFSSYPARGLPAWTWRPYSGVNAHTSHMHISVQPDRYDDDRPWGLVDEEDDVYVIRYGQNGPRVKRAQVVLQAAGREAGEGDLLPVHGPDGDYGDETAEAIDRMARRAKLDPDGDVGMDVLVLDYLRNWLSE